MRARARPSSRSKAGAKNARCRARSASAAASSATPTGGGGGRPSPPPPPPPASAMLAVLPPLAMLPLRLGRGSGWRSHFESLYQKGKAMEAISGSGWAATSSSASTGACTSGVAVTMRGRYASPTYVGFIWGRGGSYLV